MGRDDVIRELLAGDEAFGTSLLVVALDRYGTECLRWHPGTLRQELEADFALQIPQHNLDKLLAAASVVTSDAFRKDPKMFVDLTNALCGDGFDPENFDPATAAECAWSVTEAALLDPFEGPDDFSPEVRRYVGEVLKEEGFLTAPPVLAGMADFRPQTPQGFADDPELYGAVYEAQRGRTEEVRAMLEANLRELFGQLEGLSLANGSTQGLLAKASSLIRALAGQ